MSLIAKSILVSILSLSGLFSTGAFAYGEINLYVEPKTVVLNMNPGEPGNSGTEASPQAPYISIDKLTLDWIGDGMLKLNKLTVYMREKCGNEPLVTRVAGEGFISDLFAGNLIPSNSRKFSRGFRIEKIPLQNSSKPCRFDGSVQVEGFALINGVVDPTPIMGQGYFGVKVR